MDRTKYIPPIVSLAGALVACIATIINEYSNLEMTLIVLVASILFYIAGAIIRMLAVKILVKPELETSSESGEEEGSEDGEENPEDTDEVSEKNNETNEQQV